jgi:isoleucyl-tRNA synthetase
VEGTSDVWILATALKDKAEERFRKGMPGLRLGQALLEVKGAELEGAKFRHPWIDRDSVSVLGDYVTLDAGTGVVHTAPGHGWDDYLTGVRYGLDIYCPVDEGGRFLPEVEGFAGQKVFDANPGIVSLLGEKGRLVHAGKERHSYPICWRCKNPVIFRATEQWFIALDRDRYRERALEAIARVEWYPAWGEERIRNMIANRPDWCISRQRLWGVPIPAFYCKGCGKAILEADLIRRVADVFETETADAWYERDASALLPPGYTCPGCQGAAFDKEKDILDVWFDSGSSHAVVLGRRPDLPWPAGIYLEGSDQHRGWFHSSLLIGVATKGAAPYREVLTHGFTMDQEGRKMSKSLGNVVDPQKIVAAQGAEILRLWVSMVDYREDMRISDEILKRLSEAYRKIRNTCRYLLSNLFDFNPETDSVPEERLEGIDRYALMRHREVASRVLEAYRAFEFHTVYHQLVQYCAVDLSSFYMDVLKDRLYCEAAKGGKRRSAQTVLHRIAADLARLVAPILPFTADEVWAFLPGTKEDSVHLALFPGEEAPDASVLKFWEGLLDVRLKVTKSLEEMRAAKASSLDASVEIRGRASDLEPLRRYEAEGPRFPTNLASLFITSSVALVEEDVPLSVNVTKVEGARCERCWIRSTGVGSHKVHPSVCERCARVLEAV